MKLCELKEKLNNDIDDKLLACILFEMNRYFDKQFVTEIKRVQKENGIVFDFVNRKELRKAYYYGDFIVEKPAYHINHIAYTNDDLNAVLLDVENRLNTYDEDKILMSINERAKTLNSSSEIEDKQNKH